MTRFMSFFFVGFFFLSLSILPPQRGAKFRLVIERNVDEFRRERTSRAQKCDVTKETGENGGNVT
jgi:hypothetical protein